MDMADTIDLRAQPALGRIASVPIMAEGKDDDTARGIVASLRQFLEANRISTSGVCAITVHENHTTSFSSLLVDMDAGRLLDVLRGPDGSSTELTVGPFLVCYRAGLSVPSSGDGELASNNTADDAGVPFCCSGIVPYKPTRTDRESAFTDLLQAHGHHPKTIFEVKRQVDRGALLSTRYYQLVNGKLSEVEGPFSAKLHSFKNFKCERHRLFFGIDLYASRDSSRANVHHMRLFPYTKVDSELLGRFFEAAAASGARRDSVRTFKTVNEQSGHHGCLVSSCCESKVL